MLILEETNKEAKIRIHKDYMKSYEESLCLLEESYKLALLEIYESSSENKDW